MYGHHHRTEFQHDINICAVLRFIKQHDIKNVVWVTADVHYASATHYAPERAQFTDFKPFWEFVGGPINAGTFGPGEIDRTFGPDVRFVSIPADMKQNRSPAELLQFFGIGKIDRDQLESYAQRKGLSVDETERWLRPLLKYA